GYVSNTPIHCIESLDGNYVGTVNQYYNFIDYLSLFKLDRNGNLLWEFNYNDSSNLMVGCNAIVQTLDSGFAMTGGLDGHCFLLRTNKAGQPLWLKDYTDVIHLITGNKILTTPEHGFLIAGSAIPFTSANAIVIKTDSSGDTLWTKMLSGPEAH